MYSARFLCYLPVFQCLEANYLTTNAHCSSLSDTQTEQAENALAEARDLKAWWDKQDWWRQSNAGATSVERFELFPASPENDAT